LADRSDDIFVRRYWLSLVDVEATRFAYWDPGICRWVPEPARRHGRFNALCSVSPEQARGFAELQTGHDDISRGSACRVLHDAAGAPG
jgi:hypothetical protein